jgi:aldose sugar dehydrogenase
MESPRTRTAAFRVEAGFHRQARRPVFVFVVLASLAITPFLWSADTAAAPTFTQTNLVSDVPGMAQRTDPNLVNPWGVALGLNSGLWISANGAGKAAAYDGTGQVLASSSISIPAPGKGGTSAPTGVATNATSGFVITSGQKSAPSAEIFATEDGTIAGWNSSVDPANAVIAVDNSSSGAIYKGLAMGFTGDGAFLFATNFHTGTIDVFDSTFHAVHLNGFRDPQLPAGYAPFGIAAINGQLYVTYAQQDQDKKDDVKGAGNGFIDVFDMDGKLSKRFASQGQLNSPWGMAWAPFEGFGKFNNALFVGNFGDGSVNAFDFDTGEFLGAVSSAGGTPIHNDGVWALAFGLGVAKASSTTLFFTAGIGNEKHGLFGSLTVDASSVAPPDGPTLTDNGLKLTTVVSGLNQPTSMAFLGDSDFLILEKASGKVQHVINGSVVGTALDLVVNSASERGLLGIALQPNFANTHGVYLYWTESSSGFDSTNLADVPLLGNRVDRYVWDGASGKLSFDQNIIRLRSFQADDNQPMRGNHDGGKILFGPDGKLYIQIGDQGRRGQLQNLATGPFEAGQADDQFGGPMPDDAHLTGVILRLNPDGSTPPDNPFAKMTAADLADLELATGLPVVPVLQNYAVLANIRKVFSYGRRNGFGLAFDPVTGFLWESENGDDAFDEINHITAGSNGGWIQIMGPASMVADYKGIEASFTPLQGNLSVAGNLPFSAIDPTTFIPALQQVRWSPTRIADSPGQARQRLFVLPGSHYEDPEFSWKWAVAPAAIGFAGSALGAQHAGNLFVGASRTFLDEGFLFEFKFDQSRQHLAFDDPKLKDGVDNNEYKFDEGESSSLVAGKNFGIVTNIVTGPDGGLYVTSLSNGKVYLIH